MSRDRVLYSFKSEMAMDFKCILFKWTIGEGVRFELIKRKDFCQPSNVKLSYLFKRLRIKFKMRGERNYSLGFSILFTLYVKCHNVELVYNFSVFKHFTMEFGC